MGRGGGGARNLRQDASPQTVDISVLEHGVHGVVHGDELEIDISRTLPSRDLTRECKVKAY
jgi:hypothetical protein